MLKYGRPVACIVGPYLVKAQSFKDPDALLPPAFVTALGRRTVQYCSSSRAWWAGASLHSCCRSLSLSLSFAIRHGALPHALHHRAIPRALETADGPHAAAAQRLGPPPRTAAHQPSTTDEFPSLSHRSKRPTKGLCPVYLYYCVCQALCQPAPTTSNVSGLRLSPRRACAPARITPEGTPLLLTARLVHPAAAPAAATHCNLG